MLHFKCSDIDLRPYERAVVKINTIVNPVFVCNDDSSLINFIRNKIGYPGACYERLEEGVVVLQINISNEGKLDTVILLHSVSEKLDSVALNAVKMSSPYWLRPAYMNSSAIPYSYVLPICFKINEPYFKEQAILDSIHKMAMLDDSEAEYGYLKKYYNLNPFNYEKLLRLKKLSKKLNMGLTESEFIDYSSIEAEFLDEVIDYQKLFKFYFDDYWKVTEKEKASYFILTDAYPFSTRIANYTSFSMDMIKYSTGGVYKGKQEGYYQDFYKDGTLRCEMTFNNGMPINLLKVYFPSGELKHEIFMNKRQFEIRQYKGVLGNNLLESKEIVWEYSNIRDEARDSLHLVCHFSPKNQTGTWSLFKGGKIVCEETYLKGKFKSCFLFEGANKIESKESYISSDFLIPMSALFYHETQYSSFLKPETLQLIKSFDPDLSSEIMLIRQ
jgi:TonB family protein